MADNNELAQNNRQDAKAPSKTDKTTKLFLFIICVVTLAFLVSVVIPTRPFFFSSRVLLYISLTVVLLKAFSDLRKRERSTFMDVLPFLILFLFASFRVSRFEEYRFGVDDACYYSYVSSVLIDGDLELSNQYAKSKLEKHVEPEALFAKTPAGYTVNIYPVGLSFYWSPFFLAGHFLAKLFDFPLDGYSRPYTHAVLIGNLFYVCAGVFFTYRFCKGFFSKLAALISTVAILLTTPHLRYYFHSVFLTSEAPSFALIALFLFLIFLSQDKFSPLRWLGIGIFFGTLIMLRLQNAIVGIVPIVLFYFSLSGEKKTQRFLKLAGLFAAGSFIGFLPQLIVWRVMNGDWFFSAAGDFLPYWKSPFILETLFSARNSLFPWSPVVVLSITGLFLLLRKNRFWACTLLVVLFLTIWMNSAHYDWWGAASVGARRFVPLCSVFALGIAALFITLKKLGRIVLLFCLLAFMFLNSFLVWSIIRGQIDTQHAVRFSDLLTTPYSLFRPVVYAMQFPVQAAYRTRFGTPLYGPLTELFIGEDIFYFQKRAGVKMLQYDSPLFGEGWNLENGISKTNGPVSILYVPLFMKEKPRIVIELDLRPSEQEKDVRIDFFWNGKLLRSRKISADGGQLEVVVRPRDYRPEVNQLEMQIYRARTEAPAPTLILRQIRFRSPRDSP